jgi:hypothetical protein
MGVSSRVRGPAADVKSLLDNRLAPVTWEVGFLETPVHRATEAFLMWRRRFSRMESREIGGDLQSLLCQLSPLTDAEPNRFLCLSTAGGWTAFFDNGAYGTDSFGPMSVLARDLHVRGVKARWVPDVAESPTERRGSVIFELLAPEKTEFINVERVVAVMHDGDRWIFDQVGTPLPFEELRSYEAKRKRDRFTPELLDTYLRALNIRMFDENFYAPDSHGTLMEKLGRLPTGTREYPLEACAHIAS